jgi:hypothetical protein
MHVKNIKTGNIKTITINEGVEKREQTKLDNNPKHWSNKFWGENSLSDVFNESIEADSIDVDGFDKKENLSPDIWEDNMLMKTDVRKALLGIAQEFLKYSDLDQLTYKDITLTGSLANYNWTEVSDLDVHILLDFKQIADDQILVGDYLKNKKSIWNDKLPITVKNHEVEMYVQDINETHASTGVYSLINNDWTTKPIQEMIQLDAGNIQLKAADIMNTIDDLEDNENTVAAINVIERLLDKIKKMRESGLNREGEFSTENIVFKILRRHGYIDKLYSMKDDLITQELTLETLSLVENIGDPHKGIYNTKYGSKLDWRKLLRDAKNTGIITVGVLVGILAGTGMSPDELRQYGVDNVTIEKTKNFINTTLSDVGDFIKNPSIDNNVPVTHDK